MTIASAVIGCGRMGAFTSEVMRRHAPAFWFPLSHAEAVVAHPRLSLDALCDTNEKTLDKAAAAYGVGRCYTDPHRLLADMKPSLLCLATRTHGRSGLIANAVDAGVRALHMEKPLCNTVRELNTIAGILGRDDVFATYGAIRRHLKPYRAARALADSGAYGPLREIRVAMGRGSLYWSHPHSIDLILFAAGDRTVSSAQGRLAEVEMDGKAPIVDSDPQVISASVYFDDGVAGHITQALGSDLILSCADAEIIVRADGRTMEVYTAPDGVFPALQPAPAFETSDEPGGTLAALSQLADCMDGTPGSILANRTVKRDILRGQQIAFAIVQSHLEGSRPINPQDIDAAMVIHARTKGVGA